MNTVKKTIKLYDHEESISIEFYQNNDMPALMLVDEDHNFLQDLTTNIRDYIDGTVSIRSDEKAHAKALVDAGWIKDKPVISIPSGFIRIDYYPLTKEALEMVIEKAERMGINYPK